MFGCAAADSVSTQLVLNKGGVGGGGTHLRGSGAELGDPMTTEFSTCETEIMWLIAAGWISKEIAARLKLSERTVETHRERAQLKLGANLAARRVNAVLGV